MQQASSHFFCSLSHGCPTLVILWLQIHNQKPLKRKKEKKYFSLLFLSLFVIQNPNFLINQISFCLMIVSHNLSLLNGQMFADQSSKGNNNNLMGTFWYISYLFASRRSLFVSFLVFIYTPCGFKWVSLCASNQASKQSKQKKISVSCLPFFFIFFLGS